MQGVDTPVAPDLLIAECANVFWRHCRQGDISGEEARESGKDTVGMNRWSCSRREAADSVPLAYGVAPDWLAEFSTHSSTTRVRGRMIDAAHTFFGHF